MTSNANANYIDKPNDTNASKEPSQVNDSTEDTSKTNMKRPREEVNEDSKETSSADQAPITVEGEMPQKKFYRSRAHCNPLSHNDTYEYPAHPDLIDWKPDHYPNLPNSSSTPTKAIAPDVLDIGCGFGGLTIALSKLLPDRVILGLEIRAKVTEYVRLRIAAFRKENPGQYENCSVLRSNTMKFMPNFFHKASLEKIFFCFPDPHFKKKNFPRRIISERLLSEYAYVLKPGTGRLYCITDVEDLHNWHLDKCRKHPMFRELSEEEMSEDPCVEAMKVETEEGKKVERSGAKKYYAVYQRLCPEDVPPVNEENFFDKNEFGVVAKGGGDEQITKKQ